MLSSQNLLIGLLLLFCCYATYTDLRERKIKNLCSYGLIYAGILSQVVAVLSGSSGLLNSIFTVVGGFLIVIALYWFGIFAAGDAKLVWGASLLMIVCRSHCIRTIYADNPCYQYFRAVLHDPCYVPLRKRIRGCFNLHMGRDYPTNPQSTWRSSKS